MCGFGPAAGYERKYQNNNVGDNQKYYYPCVLDRLAGKGIGNKPDNFPSHKCLDHEPKPDRDAAPVFCHKLVMAVDKHGVMRA